MPAKPNGRDLATSGMMAEPLTTLTDYGLTLQSWLLALLLFRMGPLGRLWAAAFGSVGAAALLGGTYHGFVEMLSYDRQLVLWQGSMVMLAVTSFWVLVAAAWERASSWRLVWLTFAACKLVLSLVMGEPPVGFAPRVVDYLISLGIALTLYLWRLPKRSLPGGRWMVWGLLLSILAPALLVIPWPDNFRISPAAVYHLVQMIALYSLYRGIRANNRPWPVGSRFYRQRKDKSDRLEL